MKTLPGPEHFFRGFVMLGLISIVTSCSDDKDPVSLHTTAQFTQATLSVSENAGVQDISISLDRPAPTNGEIILSTNAPSSSCVITEPASLQGQLKLSVLKGQSVIVFKMLPVDNELLDGCKIVKFNMTSLSDGLSKGLSSEIVVSVNDDESPASARFNDHNVSVRENDSSPARITIEFTNAAPADGVLVVSLQSFNNYEQEYYTKPAAVDGKVFLNVSKGATSSLIEVYPVNDNAFKPERTIIARMIQSSGGVVIGSDTPLWCTITEDDGQQLIPPVSSTTRPRKLR